MVALAATMMIVWRTHSGALESTIGSARVTASSAAPGTSPGDAIAQSGSGWRSAGETAGAWLDLAWPTPHTVHRVIITRNPLVEPGLNEGYLAFGDGSYQEVRLSSTSPTTEVAITPRSIDRLRFTATATSAGARDVTIARLEVIDTASTRDVAAGARTDGNIAPDAVVTSEPASSPGDDRALVDGPGRPGPIGLGADWTDTSAAAGTAVVLRWSSPRDVSSVEVAGSTGAGASIRSARLTFDDGSSVPMGEVLRDPDRPTAVAFMPRTTSTLRFTIDSIEGSGALSLAEVRVHQRDAAPSRIAAPTSAPSPTAELPPASCAGQPAVDVALIITCPQADAVTGDHLDLRAAAGAGYVQVNAQVWPADPVAPSTVRVAAPVSATGSAVLPIDLAAVPPGPATVAVEATGTNVPTASAYVQIYRPGRPVGLSTPSEPQASGRTLVYTEEFDRPVSLSRTGLGADYATAKPTSDGAEDFGDAIFPDPNAGLGNVGVLDGLLHIGVEPLPLGYADPVGGGRTSIGGLVASARPGGSGFSAQYGYFETRMFAPASPGTWPAFWLLPNDNLVEPTSSVAEIDAVELYGHEPTGACHSTHQFRGGSDGGTAHCDERFLTARDAMAWHTYGVSVLPNEITFYIDGRVVATAPQVDGGSAPMFFLVDLALGGGWPIDLRAVQGRAGLYVDYVRVYV
ncbi:family 16 glycosylhydrolase [Actinomycetospora rhizophila]|uniref:Family 16 glycosylhydrolase n=1 Tax=Actinomycetospora rhizophila TaxID=1416876 RepID=A0ABV9ZL90_9PSEU